MGLYLQGLAIGLAYVAPIGMQNLFVINAALTQPRRRLIPIALIVIFFDVSLLLACFFGIGALVERFSLLQAAVLAAGGPLMEKKNAGGGITLALAQKPYRMDWRWRDE